MQNLKTTFFKSFAVSFFTIFLNQTYACDICGCSTAGLGLGQINTLGKRYFLVENINQKLAHPSMGGSSQSYDNLNQIQLTYAWKNDSTPNIQWLIQMPTKQLVRHNVYLNHDQYRNFNLGDISLKAVYTAYDNRRFTLSQSLKKILLIQGGLTSPSGKYQTRGAKKEMLPIHLQPGTGAWQTDIAGLIFLKKNNWGAFIQSQIQFGFKNELDYQMGLKSMNGISIFKSYEKKQRVIIPQLGFWSDYSSQHHQFKQPVSETGGQLNFCSVQLDYLNDRNYIKAKIDIPISQNTNYQAPKPQYIASVSMGWFLK